MKRTLLLFAVVLSAGWAFWPRPVLSHAKVATTVSFDKEIVRILERRCVMCHTDDNLSIPFTSYEATRPWARAIQEEILRRHMPPWRAVPGYGKFANDNGMTNREFQFFIAWIEGNGPKTKGQQLIINIDQVEAEVDPRLVPDFSKWQLGEPDLEATLPVNQVAPFQGNSVRRVTVDPGLTSERRIRALEFKPGDRRVVRAAFFSVEGTGQWLGSWTPWYGITTLPDDSAYVLPAGAKIVAELHYRSAEQPVDEAGTLGLYFASRPAAFEPADLVVEAKPEGPAGPRQKFAGSTKLSSDVTLLAFNPELPPGLDSFEVSAKNVDGTVDVLLLVRDVLPEWPTPYVLADPLTLPKDTELVLVAYADPPKNAPAPATSMKLTVSVTGAAAPSQTNTTR